MKIYHGLPKGPDAIGVGIIQYFNLIYALSVHNWIFFFYFGDIVKCLGRSYFNLVFADFGAELRISPSLFGINRTLKDKEGYQLQRGEISFDWVANIKKSIYISENNINWIEV